MQDPPTARGDPAQRQRPGQEYALYVTAGLPPEPDPTRSLALPLPLPPHESAERELALRHLYLPGWMLPRTEVAPLGVERGLQHLWSYEPVVGLHLPAQVAARWALDRNTRPKVLVTPDQVGITFPPAVLEPLAWTVLTRFPAELIVRLAATFAVRTELIGEDLSPGVAAGMKFGDPRGRVLKTLAAAGEPFFSQDCLRRIVREAAAAHAAGAWAAPWATPVVEGSDHYLAARVLFPSLLSSSLPGAHEIMRALWVLHQSFTYGQHASATDPHEMALSMITAMSTGQPQRGSWRSRLERWKLMLNTPDADPAVKNVGMTPSAFRAMFESEVGVSCDEWFALAWFLCTFYFAMATDYGPLGRDLDWLLSRPFEDPLRSEFRDALRDRVVADVETVGRAVLDELTGAYGGLGSLLSVEGNALRDSPLIEAMPGFVVPVGVHLLADRAVAVPRHEVDPASVKGGRAGHLLGKMFEAEVREVALRAQGRHIVITGDQIDAVLPPRKGKQPQRCDALIIDGDHWLFVESGLQTLKRKVGDGDVPTITSSCEFYHKKADQAEATLKHASAIADRYDLIPPRRSSILVVADVTVPLTVPLVDELRKLRKLRKTRPPLFIAGFQEFEMLVAAGQLWSIPGIVASWQNGPDPVSLFVSLYRLGLTGPVPPPVFRVDRTAWFTALGTKLAV